MKKQIITFFLLLFYCVSSFSQNTKRSFVKDSLDNYINQALQDWKIPGVAVAIVKDGKLVLAKGYGVKNLESKEAVDENTLFMIGSNTKAFT